MSSHPHRTPAESQIAVDVRGPGEWIVRPPQDGRSLHVYRLGPSDWLVSEVGLRNEGRGRDLALALSALSDGGSRAAWWDAVTEATLGGEDTDMPGQRID